MPSACRLYASPLVAALCIASGCAAYEHRRERYQNLGDRELIVRGQADEFTVGGRAVVWDTDCSPPAGAQPMPAAAPLPPCREAPIGGADVIERLDRFHFVIRVDEDIDPKSVGRITPAR